MPDSTETRTYEVTTKGGEFRITVPVDVSPTLLMKPRRDRAFAISPEDL